MPQRAAHIGDDSEGSPEAGLSIARLIATWSQRTIGRIDPEAIERLPEIVDEAVAVLGAEGLELRASVVEPGVHVPVHTMGDGTLHIAMNATFVRIRFVARPAAPQGLLRPVNVGMRDSSESSIAPPSDDHPIFHSDRVAGEIQLRLRRGPK